VLQIANLIPIYKIIKKSIFLKMLFQNLAELILKMTALDRLKIVSGGCKEVICQWAEIFSTAGNRTAAFDETSVVA
jgi:hypothetical protein